MNSQSAPTIFHLASTIQATIHNNYRFEQNYQVSTIVELIEWGRGKGIPDELIHDFICTGSRRRKFLSAEELKSQIDAYLTTVQVRGFPFGFASLSEFQNFQGDLQGILRHRKIPMLDVRVHGSSLRTPAAKDIDLLAVLRPDQFQELASRYNQPLGGMDYPGTRRKIRKANEEPAYQAIQEDLKQLSMRHGLDAVDLLVVAEGTYFPNRPYLQCRFIC